MTHLVDRLVELRRHLRHLQDLNEKVQSEKDLRSDLTLHNDVLFSLLTAAQLIIDVAGQLCTRRNLRFETYRESICQLAAYEEFPRDLLQKLERLPGFRNVVVHDYIDLDFGKVVQALRDLEPLEEFVRIAARLE